MNTTTHHTTRDVIAADDWLRDWATITGEERYERFAARRLAGLDTTIPDGAWRNGLARDVGAPLAQQDGAPDVLDLRNPHAALLARWAAADGLTDDERAARAKAADGGAGEVLDLSNLNAGRIGR